MSDPDPNLLHAYSVARADRPCPGKGKAQTLAALGLSVAGATNDAASHEPASGVARRVPGWAWWTIGVAFVVTSGVYFRAKHGDAPSPAVVSAPSTAPAVSVASALTDPAARVLTVDQLPDVAEPASSADAKLADAKLADTKLADTKSAPSHRAARPLAPEAKPESTQSLRDEIEAIERASRALSQRHCALAKSHLAAYHAKFPSGRLQREAEVVSIEIDGRSGHDAVARAAARRFVAQFPDSPYALRLAPWLRDGASDGAGPGSGGMCVDAAD